MLDQPTGKAEAKSKRTPAKRAGRGPRNTNNAQVRRKKSRITREHKEWEQFVEMVRERLRAFHDLPNDLKRSPYHAPSNIIRRSAYEFYLLSRQTLKPRLLEEAIDDIRVAHIGEDRARTLRKDIKKDPFYWILMGLHFDCPEATLRKSEVTRFAQHLNYARRHDIPPEFLVGFLMQTGSNAEVYRRALNPDMREQWFLEKANGK
ncbi:hypothetical protein [Novosphingobium sp. B1]|uniref:hypothetical protein n=1 Tax=Novosphingobium sp. B1 TaxID=1938756 RepID=UPI0009D8FA8C|nr:hypothetical protein [Novosphingobium sp. B1]SMC82695.1 hypothetical protein SAMN06272759_1085 [Novosphingobium sp. B1]